MILIDYWIVSRIARWWPSDNRRELHGDAAISEVAATVAQGGAVSPTDILRVQGFAISAWSTISATSFILLSILSLLFIGNTTSGPLPGALSLAFLLLAYTAILGVMEALLTFYRHERIVKSSKVARDPRLPSGSNKGYPRNRDFWVIHGILILVGLSSFLRF